MMSARRTKETEAATERVLIKFNNAADGVAKGFDGWRPSGYIRRQRYDNAQSPRRVLLLGTRPIAPLPPGPDPHDDCIIIP